MSGFNNTGDVTATGTVGSLCGYISTDNSSSHIFMYEYSGKVNGVEVTSDKLFGSLSNFSIG